MSSTTVPSPAQPAPTPAPAPGSAPTTITGAGGNITIGGAGNIWVYGGGTNWVTLTIDLKMLTTYTIEHKAHNSNSKRLLREIVRVVKEAVPELITRYTYGNTRSYDYEQLQEYVDLYFADLVEDHVVNRYDVICDHRNNTDADGVAGRIHLDIRFQQFNCLNTTSVKFTICDDKVPVDSD